MKLVMKFGGTSLENASRIKQAAKVIQRFLEGNKIAVVVSAIGDTTDWLAKIGDAGQKRDGRELKKLRRKLRRLHVVTARAVVGRGGSGKLVATVEDLLSELDRAVEAVLNLRELSPRSRD